MIAFNAFLWDIMKKKTKRGIFLTSEQLVSVTLKSNSIENVAKKTGKTRRGLQKEMRWDPFRRFAKECREAALKQTVMKINDCAPACVDILADIANCENINPSFRISACRSILSIAGKLTLLDEMIDKAFYGDKAEGNAVSGWNDVALMLANAGPPHSLDEPE
jgi:hypothetical protein